ARDTPAANRRMTWARRTMANGALVDRTICSSFVRSVVDSTITRGERRAMPMAYQLWSSDGYTLPHMVANFRGPVLRSKPKTEPRRVADRALLGPAPAPGWKKKSRALNRGCLCPIAPRNGPPRAAEGKVRASAASPSSRPCGPVRGAAGASGPEGPQPPGAARSGPQAREDGEAGEDPTFPCAARRASLGDRRATRPRSPWRGLGWGPGGGFEANPPPN